MRHLFHTCYYKIWPCHWMYLFFWQKNNASILHHVSTRWVLIVTVYYIFLRGKGRSDFFSCDMAVDQGLTTINGIKLSIVISDIVYHILKDLTMYVVVCTTVQIGLIFIWSLDLTKSFYQTISIILFSSPRSLEWRGLITEMLEYYFRKDIKPMPGH